MNPYPLDPLLNIQCGIPSHLKKQKQNNKKIRLCYDTHCNYKHLPAFHTVAVRPVVTGEHNADEVTFTRHLASTDVRPACHRGKLRTKLPGNISSAGISTK